MIKNEREYGITTRAIERFEKALTALRRDLDTGSHDDQRWRRIHETAMVSEVGTLRQQLAEFDELRSGESRRLPLAVVSDIPAALVKARIAAGLSQAELAARLDLTEEQLQRHEAQDYRTVSVGDLLRIARILGIEIRGDLKLAGAQAHAAD